MRASAISDFGSLLFDSIFPVFVNLPVRDVLHKLGEDNVYCLCVAVRVDQDLSNPHGSTTILKRFFHRLS